MEFIELGSSQIKCSRIGIGTWPMAGTRVPGDYGVVDKSAAERAIGTALAAGINLFDTAPTYGEGNAEIMLGKALGSKRDEAIIVTKCGNYWDDDQQRWVPDSSYDAIVRGVDASLNRLATDFVDVLLVHNPDPNREPGEAVRAVDDLKREGKIRAFGVSNYWPDEIAGMAHLTEVSAAQMGYHMFDRRIEREALDTCDRLGVSVMAFGSLGHGLLSGSLRSIDDLSRDDWRRKGSAFGLPLFTEDNFRRNLAVIERLDELATELNLSLPQLALAWVLSEPRIAVALAGVINPEQVAENVLAAAAALTDPDRLRIDAILADAAGTSRDAAPYRI